MNKKIIIIGGRGTAVVIAEQIQNAIDKFSYKGEILGFAIDDPSYGGSINEYPIIAGIRDVHQQYGNYDDVYYVYSLYRPDVMKERIELLCSLGIPMDKYLSFVHPSCVVAKSAVIGFGNVILANTVVNPNVVIGHHNTINSNCLIGHDSNLSNYNYIAGHTCVGSNIQIGDGNFIGLKSSIRNFISIGNFCIIGMASNVTKSINEVTVYGNPAKPAVLSGSPIR